MHLMFINVVSDFILIFWLVFLLSTPIFLFVYSIKSREPILVFSVVHQFAVVFDSYDVGITMIC